MWMGRALLYIGWPPLNRLHLMRPEAEEEANWQDPERDSGQGSANKGKGSKKAGVGHEKVQEEPSGTSPV